jgi:DNA-binding response OmpR family regulator
MSHATLGRTVLVISNDSETKVELEKMLGRLNRRHLIVPSCQHVIELGKLKSSTFEAVDCVILDLVSETQVDLKAMIALLRAEQDLKNRPLIILKQLQTGEDLQGLIKIGVDRVIAKPLDIKELEMALKVLCP